jgi:hypothetical protein
MSKEQIGLECKFAIHIPSRDGVPDYHLIKEKIHYSDGSSKPNIKLIKNFKRSFYITKPNKRNHLQKKEWESIDNLLEVQCTQSELRNKVSNVLEKRWSKDSLRQLNISPYIYGTDITSTAIIKKMYQDKYPEHLSKYSLATFDVETDVLEGTKRIIIATVIYENKCYTSIDKTFIKGINNVEELILMKAKKYIGEYITKHNLQIEVNVADNDLEVVKNVFSKIHEWKPDILSIWNMDFDIPRVLETLKKHNVSPEDVLCDPSLPKELRICKYRQGIKKKVTASGQVKPINPSAQWHTLICTASYYVLDAMCCYRFIRSAKQEEPSYSLEAILNKELGIRKLSFEVADKYENNKLKWHEFMQSEYKLEYTVYNMFDSLSMIELDDKIKDISYTIATYSEISDFSIFNSQPKRIADSLYFYVKNKGYILSTLGPRQNVEINKDEKILNEIFFVDDEDENENVEEDHKTLSLRQWIVTLPAHLTVLGLQCIVEDPNIRTGVRCYVYDSDAVGAYPTASSVSNVSKETTLYEICSIEGIDEVIFRKQNMDFLLGHTNALDYTTTMLNLPRLDFLLEALK